jgi:hypothetical protein
VVQEGQGVVAADVEVELEGYVEAATQEEFVAALAAATAAMGSGRDLVISGLGGQTELRLLAAQCQNGGPHVKWEMLPASAGGALRREFKLTATARVGPGEAEQPSPDPDRPPGSRLADGKTQISVTVDERRGITITGKISAFQDALGAFERTAWADAQARWPWPMWVLERRTDSSADGSECSWTITVKQVAAALPGAAGGSRALDGTVTRRRDRDEQYRLVEQTTMDLLIEGDPWTVVAGLRPRLPARVLRESIDIQTIPELRVRASFNVVRSGEGNDLLEWEQTVEFLKEDAQLQAKRYPGIRPVLVYADWPVYGATQSGRAVGLGRFPREAEPLWPALIGEQGRKIRHRQVNAFECETTWTYQFISDAPLVPETGRLGRLADPRFY